MTTIAGRVFGIASLLVLLALPALAGELTVSWAPNHDDATAGFDVEVLDAAGQLQRTLDARGATQFTLRDLPDGELVRVRVRPYDRWGGRARQPSVELVTLPAPHVDAVTGWTPDAVENVLRVSGVNFAPGARLVARRSDWRVLSATVAGSGEIVARVRAASVGAAPLPGDFLVVNPVRRSEEFLRAHPALFDVDHSGAVDEVDLALVSQAFGGKVGDARGAAPAEFDITGDGLVDGEDISTLRSFLSAHPARATLTQPRTGPQI